MSLTPAQMTTLAAHIRANTDQAVIDALDIRNDVLLARAAIAGGDGLAQLDNLTAGKRDSLLWVFDGDTLPANAAQRAAIENLCGTQNTLKAAILAAQKRVATKVEQVFATGTGSDASPGSLSWEGQLSSYDVSVALNANP
jgi:hypothetical protein